MTEPIYFPSGQIEETWFWDGASHAEDKAHVKDVGAVMWGPLENHGKTE